VIRAWEQRYTVPRRLFDFMTSTAEEAGIPYQTEIVISGGTDASTIHLTKEGVPTGEVIVARRYSHSPIEIASLRDIENAVKLLTALVQRLDSSFLAGFEKRIK
jgi:endoglucanase